MLARYRDKFDDGDDAINLENRHILEKAIKERQKYIMEQIKPYPNLPKVVFIGMTGCGKSCILCCLSGQKLLIKGGGKIKHLEGDGVGRGLQSCTSLPQILPNSNKTMLFVDCPGFEDVDGCIQEILNAFSMYYIFENYENIENKYKIILVISRDELETNKGIKMISSFKMLNEMFPIGEKLKKNIGLIITKGEPRYSGSDYIEYLLEKIKYTENPSVDLVDFCNFFDRNKDHVFSFPQPDTQQSGCQYNFADHNKLLNFLDKNILINPKHQITLSKEAKLKLRIIRNDHSKKLVTVGQNLCEKIYSQFSDESRSIELNKWFIIITNLFKENIKKSYDLMKFIRANFSNSERYKSDIEKISEFELFDAFIDQILYSNLETSCLNEVLNAWCVNAIKQLHQFANNATELENQEKLRREAEERTKEFQKTIDEYEKERKEKEKRYLEDLRRQNEANQRNLDEIKNLENQLQMLQQQIQEREENMREIQRQLQEANNRPPRIEYRTRSSGSFCLLI